MKSKFLLLIMKEEQLFLDSSLTIFSLAKEMNTNSKYLSFLINKSLQKNFMAEFSKEDIQKFETIYKEDYAYYQEAVAYFNKLSDRVNKALTVKQLWYIYMYDQELKNKLLYF